jgi:hypothetical protein
MISAKRLLPFSLAIAGVSSMSLALIARSYYVSGQNLIFSISILGFLFAFSLLLGIAVYSTFRKMPWAALSWLYFLCSIICLLIASAFVPPQ